MSLPPKQRVSPLNWREPIVNPDGTPSQQFIRLWQTMFGNGENVDAEVQQLIDAQLQAGSGIAITPDGHLLSNPMIAAEVQPILDQITDVHGSVLYRDLTGWAHLPPGTAGQFLQTQGAGADPQWAAAGGGGSWTLHATRTLSGAVSEVDFTDLTFTDALILMRGVTFSVASNTISLRTSVNNGVSYYSTAGDYVAIATTSGVESGGTNFGNTGSALATGTKSGVFLVQGNGLGSPPIAQPLSFPASELRMFLASTSPINALRLIPNAGGNFNAGTFWLLTR